VQLEVASEEALRRGCSEAHGQVPGHELEAVLWLRRTSLGIVKTLARMRAAWWA
jgi:hypothetical protein